MPERKLKRGKLGLILEGLALVLKVIDTREP